MALVRGGITVKPHVQRAANEVVEEFGPGLSPGTYNGHSPPEGPTQALDLFNPETSAGWDLQRRVADYLIKHAKRLGVRYVIKWNPNGADWIWNIERAAEGWRAMATRDHRNHVHVTFYARAENVPEPTPAPNKEDDMKGSIIGWVFNGQDYWVDRLAGTSFKTGTDAQIKAVLAMGALQLGTVDKSVHDLLNTTYKAGFDGE